LEETQNLSFKKVLQGVDEIEANTLKKHQYKYEYLQSLIKKIDVDLESMITKVYFIQPENPKNSKDVISFHDVINALKTVDDELTKLFVNFLK
jgi:hypothetical protein